MPWDIVYVEDSPGDLSWLRRQLSETGKAAEISHFANWRLALAAFARRNPPDLILTDWILPMLEFPECVERIRNVRGYERIPIAVLSSESVKEAMQGNVLCCLTKPVTAAQLEHLFAKLQSRAAAAR